MILCLIGPGKEDLSNELKTSNSRVLIVRGEGELNNMCTILKKLLGWKIIFMNYNFDQNYKNLRRIGTVIYCGAPDSECADFWNKNYDYEITKNDDVLFVRAYNSLSISYCKNYSQIFKLISLSERGKAREKQNYQKTEHIKVII
jgi:hypothetical protein